MFTFILATALVAAGSTDPAPPTTNTLPALPTTTTVAAPVDPLFPLAVGANGPAIAAVQARLGVTVDCDFGDQTAQAVNAWQTERTDLAESGQIGPADWVGLGVPITWGTDANSNGSIEPSEITLICDGNVELPAAPVDRTDWKAASLTMAASLVCELTDDFAQDVYYAPNDDTIIVQGAWSEDNAAEGETAGEQFLCLISQLQIPQHVTSQLTNTRALDGMQNTEWTDVLGNTISMQWTFHPDAGMNVTIWTSNNVLMLGE